MIRELKEQDLNRTANIWLNTNINTHNFISEQYWKDNYESVKEMFSEAEMYVYENGNMIQGFIGLYDNYIAGIFVAEDAQSVGIGKQLLDFAKTIKKQLKLNVYKKNIRAIKFYQREGFVITDESTDEHTGEKEYDMIWKENIKFEH